MALKQIRIGSMENIHQYDDGDFDAAVETDQPIKAGTPVDANDVVRLDDLTSVMAGSYRYTGTVVDDGTFNLPIIPSGALGFLVVGDDEERVYFSAKADGTINLIVASDNIVTNADTDNKVCIGTGVASPIVIKNRLGAPKSFVLQLWYDGLGGSTFIPPAGIVGTITGDMIRYNAGIGAWEVKHEPLAFKQIILTPALVAILDVEGGMWYKSTDKSVYVCTVP